MVEVKGTKKELLQFIKQNLDCPPKVGSRNCNRYLEGEKSCEQCIFDHENRFKFVVTQ